MKGFKINWVYEGEQGYWRSSEGRFSVSPIYIGRTTPQGYEVRDEMGNRVRGEDGYIRLAAQTKGGFYTVAEAKAWAENKAREELQREIG